MSKRKHSKLKGDDLAERDESREERRLDFKATRLRHKFERGSLLLFRALKTARGFERQKLGRRQKTAKQNGDEKTLERLNAEVQVLKTLDLAETAGKHLFKQLVKTKRIAECSEFARLKSSLSISLSGPRDVAEANVTARLFKSNSVKNVLPDVVNGIKELLGLDDISIKKAVGRAGRKVVETGEDTIKQHKEKPSFIHEENDQEHRLGAAVSNDVSMDDAEQESVDFARFDVRLASSRESESGAETDGKIQKGSQPMHTRYNPAADLSLSPSPSPSRSASESPPPSKVKGGKKADAPTKATIFLPSLMMGGYWSGTESEADDDDVAETAPRRKNRRGQQARRALWEKKYGNGAKHLQQLQQKRRESRDRGWDTRKGATEENGDMRPKWGKQRAGQPSREWAHGKQRINDTENRSAAPQHQRPKKLLSEDKTLHPSWEAARKAKEQKAQTSFQGKKIVFD